jgi:hypothetical protein
MTMVTDWIQAVCSIITVLVTLCGICKPLRKISKDIKESEQQWKGLIELYAKNPVLHEYSNLNGSSDKKSAGA